MRAFPKPHESEGKITLTPKERQVLLANLYMKQNGHCCTCDQWMTRQPGFLNTATLGHDKPQPMGAKKRDNLDNILGAQCWKCNAERGSKRG